MKVTWLVVAKWRDTSNEQLKLTLARDSQTKDVIVSYDTWETAKELQLDASEAELASIIKGLEANLQSARERLVKLDTIEQAVAAYQAYPTSKGGSFEERAGKKK